ncbi:MAG TPA: hypothetical protein VH639_20340 [Bryobacteraceae bacterium]
MFPAPVSNSRCESPPSDMNAEQLWETTMNAETRTLLKVSLEDLVQSDQIFTTLMGEDVESRRKFIEENALDVRNLDV